MKMATTSHKMCSTVACAVVLVSVITTLTFTALFGFQDDSWDMTDDYRRNAYSNIFLSPARGAFKRFTATIVFLSAVVPSQF